MTLTLEGLKAQFQHPNLVAFSHCVRSSESNNRDDDSAYRTIYGGELVSDLSCHPRIAKQSPWGYTSAAGAYQAMCAVPGRVQTDTWGDFCKDMGVPVDAMPFDPPTQDAFLVWCVRRRNALQAVIDGDLEKAITLCSYEWASFPPGRYGQPTTTIDKLRAVFLQYGGRLSNADLIQPAAPIEERPQPPQLQQPETAMPLPLLALLSFAGPIISELIPAVAKLFDRKSETPEKLTAAQKVIDTIVSATNSAGVDESLTKLKADPALLEKVKAQVLAEPSIGPLLTVEIGGGIAGAREADKAQQASDKPFYKTSAVFWISLLLLPMVLWYVGSSIVGGVEIPADWPWYAQMPLKLFGTSWDAGAKVGLANLVVGMILGGIVGVYYGVSVTQNKQQSPTKEQA